jgi:ribosomal protein S18 acetylase RimI-like enzyme
MTIRTELLKIDQLSAELTDAIDAELRAAFPDVDDNGLDTNGVQWAQQRDWRVIAWDGDDWGGVVDIVMRDITAGGLAVKVGGIGNVMTQPAKRGRGLAKAAMRHAQNAICQDLGADAGVLFCLREMVNFYSALGWEDMGRLITYRQDNGAHIFDTRHQQEGCAMVRPCRDFKMPHGPMDIKGRLW